MADSNIVILGGSYAGVNTAHYLLKFTLPALPKDKYHVHLINPSNEFFNRIAAPRSILSSTLIPEDKVFFNIPESFKAYGAGNFTFTQAKATSIDGEARSVNLELSNGTQQSLSYHALIIATGARSQDPVLSSHADIGQDIHRALEDIRKNLKTAKTIVIGGGGPAGVEAAGEIAEYLNGKPGWFSKVTPKVNIKLITSQDKLLPILRPALAKRAADMLGEMGVETIYNTRINSSEVQTSGKTRVVLASGETLEADVYINAIGTVPNTSYVPQGWLDARNRVATNAATLRVDGAGPRVYAVGDVGSHTRGGMLDLFDSVPVLATNIKTDLLAVAGTKPQYADREFKGATDESQVVNIGQTRAIGAFKGNKMPGFILWQIKGKDYMAGHTKTAVVGGQWKKEVAYKPTPIKAGYA